MRETGLLVTHLQRGMSLSDSQKPSSLSSRPPVIQTRSGARDFSGYAQAAGAGSTIKRALEQRVDEAKPSRGIDVLLPAMLLAIGLPLAGLLSLYFFGLVGGLIGFAVMLGLQIVLFTPMLFGGVCLVAKWFEHPLGLLPTVVFKALALTLGPAAIADVLFIVVLMGMDFDWSGLAAGFGFYLVLTGPAAAAMLGTRLPDTATLVGLIFIPRVVVAYALGFSIPSLFP